MASRRQFSLGVATAGTVVIAGCSAISSGGPSGPEDAVETFFTAAVDGDADTQNEILHPEAGAYPLEENEFRVPEEFVIEINQGSTREVAELRIEQGGESVDDVDEREIEAEVERLEQRREGQIEEMGAEDYAWVFLTMEDDDGRDVAVIEAVQDDGDWYMLFE
ncbi:hypothetical protein JCM18237_17220 [Halorubrum luteum]